MKRWALSLGLVAAFAPIAVEANPFRVGRNDQVKLGKRASAEIRKQEKVLPATDERVKKLREIASRILAANPLEKDSRGQPYPWEFTFDVIDSKDVNAFALPGGPIYFFTGLIDKFKTEDQMAAVLAHEIVHIRKEHWSAAYARQQERSLLLTGALLLFGASRTTADIAGIANELVWSLPYSRRNETEADDIGLDMMVKAGYNPNGMADVMRILGQVSRGQRPPEWASSHPSDRTRVSRIEGRIQKLNQTFEPQRPLPFGKTDAVAMLRSVSQGPSHGELFLAHVGYRGVCCSH